MLDNCDSIRKGLLYTPTIGEQIEDDIAASFEQKRGINYQHEYMRLYIANVVLTQQLKELLQEKGDLISKINRLEEDEIYKTNSRKLDYEESKNSEVISKNQIVQKVQQNIMMKMQFLIINIKLENQLRGIELFYSITYQCPHFINLFIFTYKQFLFKTFYFLKIYIICKYLYHFLYHFSKN